MPFVYSTMTADNIYGDYVPHQESGGASILRGGVLIRGGANVAELNTIINGHNMTPVGRKTEVTQEQLEFLKKDPTFITQMNAGFLKIVERDVKVEKVVADEMEKADASAPITEADYKDDGKGRVGRMVKPKLGKPE